MAEDIAATEPETREGAPRKPHGGPGFILGLLLGALTGAAAATLLGPAAGGQTETELTGETAVPPEREGAWLGREGPPQGPPTERIREMLTRLRSRMREATEEGREAAREAEVSGRARYTELTHQDNAPGRPDEFF